MQKIIKNLKWLTLSLAFGIVLGGGLITIKAWTEPTAAPPGGNIGAPINTSGIGQVKSGNLVVNGLATSASNSGNALLVPSGNVGIGTTSPLTKLDVRGDVRSSTKMRSNQYCDRDGNNCKAITAMGGGKILYSEFASVFAGSRTITKYFEHDSCGSSSKYYEILSNGNLMAYTSLGSGCDSSYGIVCTNILSSGQCGISVALLRIDFVLTAAGLEVRRNADRSMLDKFPWLH